MTALVIIEGLVILLLLVLMAGLLKSHAEILRELHRLGGRIDGETGPGGVRVTGLGEAPMTEITGTDPAGTTRTVSLAHGRGDTLIAFLSTGCAACQTFWQTLAERPRMPTAITRPVVVTKGPEAESPGQVAKLAPADLPVVMSSDAWDAFRVPLTPFFMLVDGQGRVLGEGSATNWNQLLGLLERSIADASSETEPAISPDDPTLYENPVKR